jgi:hypothetical protein
MEAEPEGLDRFRVNFQNGAAKWMPGRIQMGAWMFIPLFFRRPEALQPAESFPVIGRDFPDKGTKLPCYRNGSLVTKSQQNRDLFYLSAVFSLLFAIFPCIWAIKARDRLPHD